MNSEDIQSKESEYDNICSKIDGWLANFPSFDQLSFTRPRKATYSNPDFERSLDWHRRIFEYTLDCRSIFPGDHSVSGLGILVRDFENTVADCKGLVEAFHRQPLDQPQQQQLWIKLSKAHESFVLKLKERPLTEYEYLFNDLRLNFINARIMNEGDLQTLGMLEKRKTEIHSRMTILASEFGAAFSEAFRNAKEQEVQLSERFKSLQNVLVDLGRKSMASHFMGQAREHMIFSYLWLVASGFAFVILSAYVIFLFALSFLDTFSLFGIFSYTGADTTSELVAFTSAKVLAFGVLSGLLVFCGKNFNAHKHQLALCNFRAMLLNTVELIAASRADREDLKLGLMLEAFRAVCNEKASGYVTKEDVETHPHISDILGMLKGVGK